MTDIETLKRAQSSPQHQHRESVILPTLNGMIDTTERTKNKQKNEIYAISPTKRVSQKVLSLYIKRNNLEENPETSRLPTWNGRGD